MQFETPDADAAEQSMHVEEEPEEDEVAETQADADPADVADQHHPEPQDDYEH